MFDLPCVILAGGKSSRMGVDKSLLSFNGFDTLCEYQVSRLKPLFKSLHVSSKDNKFDFETDLILDEEDEVFSPMVALGKILSHFENEMVFIMAVDIPYVGANEIEKMYLHVEDYDIVIPRTKHYKHTLCGFYNSSLHLTCKSLIDQNIHKMQKLLDASRVKYVDFENEKNFTNLNFLDQYKKENKE